MEQGRMRIRCAAWGGVSLGIGTLAYALCSPSSAGCSTNLIVLTHSAVTARGCAAFSVLARSGIGLMLLGSVLLLGSFIVTVRARRPTEVVDPGSGPASDPSVVLESPDSLEVPAEIVVASSSIGNEAPPSRRMSERVGPIPPGVYSGASERTDPVIPKTLPPGWYGNPNNPDRPVQWWDGTRLTDRPSHPAR